MDMKKILLAFLLIAFAVNAAEVVGTLKVTRMVKVSSEAISDSANATWLDAKQNQSVISQQGIRTLKRSMAEIVFNDKSILRINERTDLVVQQSKELRNIKLNEGAVWIQVAKGSKTTVQTPTATATAKGTIFIVSVRSDGSTNVTVLEGTVDVAPPPNLLSNVQGTTSVSAGETTSVTVISVPDGDDKGSVQIFKAIIPTAMLPVELGGTEEGWTSALSTVVNGTLVTTGSEIGHEISQEIQEEIFNDPTLAYIINGIITDPIMRDAFMDIMADKVTPKINAEINLNSTGGIDALTAISAYKTKHATDNMANLYELSPEQVQLITQVLKINTVPELIDVISKNSATVNMGVIWPYAQTRKGSGSFTSTSNTAPVNNDVSYRLMDRNKSSIAIAGMGALACILANGFDLRTEINGKDGETVKEYAKPDFSGNIFAFSGNPSFGGAKSVICGRMGRSIYTIESNYLLMTGKKSNQKFDSVALFEHMITDSWSAFAGRKRYQAGPVMRNYNGTQLIFDRYTGAGISYKGNRINGEAAWLYDSNPVGSGAEKGATGHITADFKGAVIGINYLRVGQVKPGNGYTGSISTPLISNYLEGYAELGKDVSGKKIQTFGLYFPSIYQNYDTDMFVEYSSHAHESGVRNSNAYSLSLTRSAGDAIDFRFYADLDEKGKTYINGGVIWKFDFAGSKKK